MDLSIRDYLRHILDEAGYLGQNTIGLTKEKFLNDETLKRAFVRSLEIIGEAVKQISEETRRNYSQIEWRLIAGMRDRLIHGYFGVDYEIVWDAIINKIPVLEETVKLMLEDESTR
ncbi:MAG: DUF86 domain-containing protein [Pyrinomonadaceae bacterium]